MPDKPLVVVIDDDANSLSPFFVTLVEDTTNMLRVLDRWGQAANWLEENSQSRDVAAVILDIMFILPPSEHEAFKRVVGREPKPEDANQAGRYLIPLCKRSLPEVPILVLSNYTFEHPSGRDVLGEYADLVEKVFPKPAQDEFYKHLRSITESWKEKRDRK